MIIDRTTILQARDAFSITPNDAIDLATKGAALYVGVTGDVAVETFAGTTLTFKNVPVGFMPIKVNKVLATGTTATQIIGLFFKDDEAIVA